MKNIEDFYPLSPMQQGILFHTLYAPKSGMYCEQFSCTIHGEFNVSVFQKAWQQVVERHQVLRTSFVWEGLKEPAQVVHKQVSLPWQQHDWRKIASVAQKERIGAFLKVDQEQGFELAQAPLMRLTLIQLADNYYQFIWSRHHLLIDGWSLSIVLNEVFAFYKAGIQDDNLHIKPPRPYRNYVAWLQQQDMSQSERFWRQRLKGFTSATSLRIDKTPNPLGSADNNYDKQLLRLSTPETAALQALARQQQLTLNTLVQGAWAILLSRYSGENNVVFGTVVSGRGGMAGAESMVGVFINTLPARVDVNPEASLLPWLKQLQGQQNEVRQYEYSPLVEVQKWSDVLSGQPLFESILNFQNYPMDVATPQHIGNCKIFDINTFIYPHYPLTVSVKVDSELSLEIFYDCHRFHSETITRMLGHFRTLLAGMVTNLEQRIADLPLLTAQERYQQLVEWNNTQTDYPQNRCIHELFEAQVERTPDAIAVVFEDVETLHITSLTYRELNAKANQLAHYLQALGVRPEVLVGICVERSVEMVVGLLGILKAGGTYVPLDPGYPQERLALMLQDAQVSILLTQQHLVEMLHITSLQSEHSAQLVCLDSDWNEIVTYSADQRRRSEGETRRRREEPVSYLLNEGFQESDLSRKDQEKSSLFESPGCMTGVSPRLLQNPTDNATPEILAYVIYTSGSTGKPKGVQISHSAVVNFLSSMRQTPGLIAEDILLSVTTLSFDIAALEIYLPLIVGARLVLVSREVATDGTLLLQRLNSSGATVMQATPATWRLLLAAGWYDKGRLKILCGGEALNRSLANQLLERGREVWNLYGPTETTIWSAVHQVEDVVSIGRPIANTQFYILDSHQKLLPVGVPGELHIGGAGLASGYLNQPELTQQKFIPNPLEQSQAHRLYKTGDLVRYLPDGTIEFLGRIDNQVKIRGFRIELGEIEAVLTQHSAVQASVVTVREDEPGCQQLIAYVETRNFVSVQDLRQFLANKLPNYMMPSAFVMQQKLPLTPNGKVDRRALPAPDTTRTDVESTFVTPRHPVEEVVAGIWAEVLDIQKVGIYDNFFELGGHSLLATQVISRLRQIFTVDLPLRCLFESPKVAELAKTIQEAKTAELGQQTLAIERACRDSNLPLSFAQTRLWLLEQLQPGSSIYNIPTAVRLVGFLNLAALEQSLNEIVRRHEVLRTTFASVDGQPFQVITPNVTIKLPVVDLRELPTAEQEAEVQQLTSEECDRTFDLAQGLLLRCTLLCLSDNEHIALFTIHHIISDGWSMGVLIRELATLYSAFCAGKPSPLPELPIQYADFAAWQRQWFQGDVLETQLAYWKQQLGNNLPVLQLPTTRPRAEVNTNRGATQSFVIPSHLSTALQTLSRQEGVTLFMTLLAGFQVLLQRYTNQNDIVVGTDVANRNRVETEALIGFFVNLLVLRTDLSGNPSFRELLKRVREVALGAYAHQDLPFDKLVRALQPERNFSNTSPLFQVLFVLQNAPMPALELPGATLSLLEVENKNARFNLALFLTETDQGFVGKWQYNADLFAAATITCMTGHFQTLITSIVAQPQSRINSLHMLSDEEIRQQNESKNKKKASKLNKFMTVQPQAINLSQRMKNKE